MIRKLAPLAFLLCSLPAAAQTLTEQEKQDGFRPLFDGKTLDGWKTTDKTAKSWKIEDGMLVLTGGGASLYTKDSFDDFVLRLEWRAKKKGYNSGLFLRGNNQIQMQEANVGKFMPSKGSKGVLPLHKAPGEWNEWEVTCVGSKISLKVNGKLAWEHEDFKAKKGPIGIEAEGHALDFRNLRIKIIAAEKK
jgi:hypothetical protein